MSNRFVFVVCILFVVSLHTISCQLRMYTFVEHRIDYTFNPYYNASHVWDVACQRFTIQDPTSNSSNTFDIDYRVDLDAGDYYTFTRVSFPYVPKKKFWIGIVTPEPMVGNAVEYERNGNVTSLYLNPLKFQRSLCFQQAIIDLVNTEQYTFVGNWKTNVMNISDTSNFVFDVYLNQSAHYMRQQCYDLNNMRFYAQIRNRDRTVDQLVVHVLLSVLLLVMSCMPIVMSQKILVRRRFWASMVANMFIFLSFAVTNFLYSAWMLNQIPKSISPDTNKWMDLAESIVGHICPIIALTAYLFKMIRFFHVRYSYYLIFKTKSEKNLFQRMLISKRGFVVMFLLSVAVVYGGSLGLIISIYYKKHGKAAFTTLQYEIDMLNNFEITLLCFVIAIYVLEFLVNIVPIIKKGLLHYYFIDDPLFYRLEAFPTIIVTGIFFFYTFWKSVSAKRYIGVLLYDLLYGSIYVGYQLTMGSGLISLIEVYRLFRDMTSYRKTENNDSELIVLLQDERFYLMFSDYCLSEQSSENLELFRCLEKGRASGLSYSQYAKVYMQFIATNAPVQVNMSYRTKNSCDELLKASPDAVFYEDDLRQLWNDVVLNLSETFMRFALTTEYKKYTEMKSIMQKEFMVDMVVPLLL